MKDLKTFFKFVKDLWSNKRTRAIVILGAYLIFMSIVVIMIRANNSRVVVSPPEIKTEYKEMNNYEFTYNIGELVIKGTHYKNEALITINNNERYYLNDDILYSVVDNKIIPTEDKYSILDLEPNKLGLIIDDLGTGFVTEYSDKTSKHEYAKDEFQLIVYKKNNLVTKIEMTNPSVVITYTNHNQISKINTDFIK